MKYVVVNEADNFIMCIGVYDDYMTAYGAGYVDASEHLQNKKNPWISVIEDLEGDTGCMIRYGADDVKEERMLILFVEE